VNRAGESGDFLVSEPAVGAAYDGIADIEEVLVLVNHYPLTDVGWRGSLNPTSQNLLQPWPS
jgi:hypothetical protein